MWTETQVDTRIYPEESCIITNVPLYEPDMLVKQIPIYLYVNEVALPPS